MICRTGFPVKSASLLMSFVATFLLFGNTLFARTEEHHLLLDGSETLSQFGLDSLGNWWAITQPYSEQYRVYINGEESDTYLTLTGLQFASSGEHWAYFGEDHTGWAVIADDTVITLNASAPGQIHFSRINDLLTYSYIANGLEYIVIGDEKISTYQKIGDYYISPNGKRYAYMSQRGSSYVMNINGHETQLYDEIKPIGFWHDGKFLYAACYGSLWELYKDDEPISEQYAAIPEAVINADGTSAGAIAKLQSGYYYSILLNDDYYDILTSSEYDAMSDIVIHPYDALIACKAELNNSYYMLMNSTEYPSEENAGAPQFTYDGSEMFFLGCRVSCFLSVNGKKIKVPNQLDPGYSIAKKPGSPTICFPTSTTLTMQNVETNEINGSLLIDLITYPIYNRISGAYETLGSINNRLYLMRLQP